MTSVTLPSTSGLLHGGYSSIAEETTSSELEFEAPRVPAKRCLIAPLGDSCKKRRKQSTPIRISAAETDSIGCEGKPSAPAPSPEPELQCPVCQLYFNDAELLQSHVLSEHSIVDCKKEPQETSGPLELTARPDVTWINEVQTKEWISPNLHSMQGYNASNPMFIALPQFAQPENLPRQPIRIFNPDAYCDLCNKEFCNKYFLKTHKANKHGIYSDPPVSEQVPPLLNNYGSIKLPTSVPTVVDKGESKATTIINPFSSMFPNPFSKTFPKTKAGIMYESESTENVPNGFSANGEIERLDDRPAEESSSPRNVQTETTSFKNGSEGVYYIPQAKLSPNNELEMANRLRRIGVMNPKAFCEICCKEYCNKYFLRTHKMKRHGIYIPDDKESKDVKHDFPWQHNMQTSPLNLIITEQTSIDRKTTSPSEISCDICGIKFQNASLSQLHNVSVHSKLYPVKDEDTSQSHQEQAELQPQQPQGELVGKDTAACNSSNEAISEDLQKLQTMILQLNELDVKSCGTTCSACSKEFENRYFLHTHMMTEHGILLDEDSEKPAESSNENSNNNTLCDLCGKDVQGTDEMKRHLMEFHANHLHPEKEDYNGFSTPEKGAARSGGSSSASERRVNMNVTPTSSYCDICNKELCNKYFMKTHMQRMHGIEIENGAQIGGVICDICNKELCSKYFLRVHKHNTHGIVEYGTNLLQPRKTEAGETAIISSTVSHISESDPSLKSADLADLSHRYFTHFTEVCSICSRRFRSTKWLKTHLLSDHGQAGAEKWAELEQQLQQSMSQQSKLQQQSSGTIKTERTSPTLKIPNGGQNEKVGLQNVLSSLFGVDETSSKSYQCSFCPFTTSLLPLLFVHERSHSEGGVPLKCPVCAQNFVQPELLQHHIFAQHPFLPLPPFYNGANEKEPSEGAEEGGGSVVGEATKAICRKAKSALKTKRFELTPDIGQTLKDVSRMAQVPAAYALPQAGDEVAAPGYVMQAFRLEETAAEKRVVPAVVFLPVFQKQPAPLTVTFTLTPA